MSNIIFFHRQWIPIKPSHSTTWLGVKTPWRWDRLVILLLSGEGSRHVTGGSGCEFYVIPWRSGHGCSPLVFSPLKGFKFWRGACALDWKRRTNSYRTIFLESFKDQGNTKLSPIWSIGFWFWYKKTVMTKKKVNTTRNLKRLDQVYDSKQETQKRKPPSMCRRQRRESMEFCVIPWRFAVLLWRDTSRAKENTYTWVSV